MAEKKPKLSIVIPAYNEERSLRKGVLDKIENYIRSAKLDAEVIIVDDGSLDQTAQLVRENIRNKKGFRLIKNPHQGKAVTVITGMMASTGEISLFTDMDQSTPLSEVEKFLPKFTEGFDIVIGSRHGRQGYPMIRLAAAWVFTVLRSLIVGVPFKDTQCGFKAFNARSRKSIFPKMLSWWSQSEVKGYAVNAGFDSELLFLAKKKDFKIAEISVEWRYAPSPHYQLLRDSVKAIQDMFRVRLNDWSGKYD